MSKMKVFLQKLGVLALGLLVLYWGGAHLFKIGCIMTDGASISGTIDKIGGHRPIRLHYSYSIDGTKYSDRANIYFGDSSSIASKGITVQYSRKNPSWSYMTAVLVTDIPFYSGCFLIGLLFTLAILAEAYERISKR